MELSALEIRWILFGLLILIVSVAVHEFGHAIVAYKLGDDTPRRQGRVTLNPLAHADPIGTILLPLVGGIAVASGSPVGGFGWGKPVEWQPHRIRRGIRMSTAKILVSFAGPAMNIVLAVAIALVSVILLSRGVVAPHSEIMRILYFAVTTNFILFFFNLLPMPPLDGGGIVQELIPYRHRQAFEDIAKYAPFFLLAMMFISPLRKVFTVPAVWCAQHLYSGLGSIVGI
jgi:Zn-dependent protease